MAQRSLIKSQHLLLVGQVGHRRRERHGGPLTFSGRWGSRETGSRRLGGRDGRRHFRFRFRYRWMETGPATMSRFKFVGKLFFRSLSFFVSSRASLAGNRRPRKRFLKVAKALRGRGRRSASGSPWWCSLQGVLVCASSRVLRL